VGGLAVAVAMVAALAAAVPAGAVSSSAICKSEFQDGSAGPISPVANPGFGSPCVNDSQSSASVSGTFNGEAYAGANTTAKTGVSGNSVIAHANVLGQYTLASQGGTHTLTASGLRSREQVNCATGAISTKGEVDFLQVDGTTYVSSPTTTADVFSTPIGTVLINFTTGNFSGTQFRNALQVTMSDTGDVFQVGVAVAGCGGGTT
jgi:hypothetical protein